jgi:hypothetical protein
LERVEKFNKSESVVKIGAETVKPRNSGLNPGVQLRFVHGASDSDSESDSVEKVRPLSILRPCRANKGAGLIHEPHD